MRLSSALSLLLFFVLNIAAYSHCAIAQQVQEEPAEVEPAGGDPFDATEGDPADPFSKPQQEKVAKATVDNPKLNKARIAELTAKIKSDEYNSGNYFYRGLEYVKGEAWKQAAADFVEIPKLKDGNSQLGQQIGILLALSGDKDSLEILAKEMTRVYGKDGRGDERERTAKVCVLTSNVTGDIKEIEKMAAWALEHNLENEWVLHYYRTMALVQYRAKKYDEALKTLQSGEARDPGEIKMLDDVLMCNRAIEAMCLHQLKKTDEAKKVLAKAQTDLSQYYTDEEKVYSTGFWHDWLSAKLLQKEADALINKPDALNNKPEKPVENPSTEPTVEVQDE